MRIKDTMRIKDASVSAHVVLAQRVEAELSDHFFYAYYQNQKIFHTFPYLGNLDKHSDSLPLHPLFGHTCETVPQSRRPKTLRSKTNFLFLGALGICSITIISFLPVQQKKCEFLVIEFTRGHLDLSSYDWQVPLV